jgi:hypothetical protein
MAAYIILSSLRPTCRVLERWQRRIFVSVPAEFAISEISTLLTAWQVRMGRRS